MEVPNGLQDDVRTFAYRLIGSHISEPKDLLDIGSRDSGFPAYLSSQGFRVTACERESEFVDRQNQWADQYNTKFDIRSSDLLEIKDKFDIITSVFALQHNAYNDLDIKCYRHCDELIRPGGTIFIVTEFTNDKSWIHTGRDDGDMMVYDHPDIVHRILYQIDYKTVEEYFFKWEGQSNAQSCVEKDAMAVCLKIKV